MDTSLLSARVHRIATRGPGIKRAYLGVAGPFPVAGPTRWSNDWHALRCEPYPHLHEGIDLFAPQGTPVVAVVDGRVTQLGVGSISGLGVEIVDGSGVQYFYAHLSAFGPHLTVGDQVDRGQVLGYIGTTGNAQGTSPHLHLEIQPGGVPVPPKPYVDRWLHLAERSAARWLARMDGKPGGKPTPQEAATKPEPLFVLSAATALGSSTPRAPEGSAAVAWLPLFTPVAAGVLTIPILVSLRRRERRRGGIPLQSPRCPSTAWDTRPR
jgi:murein DD-endopeptidase MepM/ murein hydrolase activator NlpD